MNWYIYWASIRGSELGNKAQSVVIKQLGATDRNLKVLKKILLKERTVSV